MKAIIFLNVEYSYEKRFLNEIIDEKDIIFCADGGANYTYKYNIYPNYIIGDLDSIDTIVLDFYKKEMVKIIKFDPEKNYTDFELILHEIERYQKDNNIIFDNVYVLGGLGKRLDMTLNNINLLEEYKNLTFFSRTFNCVNKNLIPGLLTFVCCINSQSNNKEKYSNNFF